MARFRLLIIYGGYLPGEKYGGPVTSLYNLTELLGDEISIFIICTNHDLKESEPYKGIAPGWNSIGKAKVAYLKDDAFNGQSFSKYIDTIEPDLIYSSSIFSVHQTYPLFSISNKKKIPLLLAPRGELNRDAIAKKKVKKTIYLNVIKILRKYKNTYFQATSDKEKKDIRNVLGVDEEKIYLLPNIPTIANHKNRIRKEPGVLKICFVGRIVENKNLLVALKAITQSTGNIIFDIYGSNEDPDYWRKCSDIIRSTPANIQITYKGVIPSLRMKDIYGNYDCMISPTCFENYGQAIVEAMIHDVPVIISRGATPWDEIESVGAGFVCSLDSIKEFCQAITRLCDMNDYEYRQLVNRLRDYCEVAFDISSLKELYMNVFQMIKMDFIKRY